MVTKRSLVVALCTVSHDTLLDQLSVEAHICRRIETYRFTYIVCWFDPGVKCLTRCQLSRPTGGSNLFESGGS